jgi:hypothetical protein
MEVKWFWWYRAASRGQTNHSSTLRQMKNTDAATLHALPAKCEKCRVSMPSVFKIPDTLEKRYHGSGYAMASVTGGQVVNLIYLRDVLPEFDDEQSSVEPAIND